MSDEQQARLAGIRARTEKATAGPWEVFHRLPGLTAADDETENGVGLDIEGPTHAWKHGQFARSADAQFIAHAREDIPYLLALVAELDADRERLIAVIRSADDDLERRDEVSAADTLRAAVQGRE